MIDWYCPKFQFMINIENQKCNFRLKCSEKLHFIKGAILGCPTNNIHKKYFVCKWYEPWKFVDIVFSRELKTYDMLFIYID